MIPGSPEDRLDFGLVRHECRPCAGGRDVMSSRPLEALVAVDVEERVLEPAAQKPEFTVRPKPSWKTTATSSARQCARIAAYARR
jgi:hypothetical protein